MATGTLLEGANHAVEVKAPRKMNRPKTNFIVQCLRILSEVMSNRLKAWL